MSDEYSYPKEVVEARRQQVEALKVRADAAEAKVAHLETQVDLRHQAYLEGRALLAQALAALVAVEWTQIPFDEEDDAPERMCPWCKEQQNAGYGHYSKCALASTIAALRAAGVGEEKEGEGVS